MTTRRSFLKCLAAVPLLGLIVPKLEPAGFIVRRVDLHEFSFMPLPAHPNCRCLVDSLEWIEEAPVAFMPLEIVNGRLGKMLLEQHGDGDAK